jgi:hypothetical protein
MGSEHAGAAGAPSGAADGQGAVAHDGATPSWRERALPSRVHPHRAHHREAPPSALDAFARAVIVGRAGGREAPSHADPLGGGFGAGDYARRAARRRQQQQQEAQEGSRTSWCDAYEAGDGGEFPSRAKGHGPHSRERARPGSSGDLGAPNGAAAVMASAGSPGGRAASAALVQAAAEMDANLEDARRGAAALEARLRLAEARLADRVRAGAAVGGWVASSAPALR